MSQYDVFTFISKSRRIPSINSMYGNKRGGGKFMTKAGTDFKTDIRDSVIKSQGFVAFKNLCESKFIVIHLELKIVFSHQFWRRDASNTTKILEDAVAETICNNDARNLSVSTQKIFNDKDEWEYIIGVLRYTERTDKVLSQLKWSSFNGR